MNDKVKQIMAAVFETDAAAINDESSPETIENWDSLRHMNLVAALEEEFDTRFSDDQIADMLNFALVIATLKENGIS